jgi:hypothetical protein
MIQYSLVESSSSSSSNSNSSYDEVYKVVVILSQIVSVVGPSSKCQIPSEGFRWTPAVRHTLGKVSWNGRLS